MIIKPGVRHQFWRADRDARPDSEEDRLFGVPKEELKQDLVIVESTEPAGRDKEVFSRQVLTLLREMKGSGIGERAWMLWSSFVVFYGHDNYPVVVGVTRGFGGGREECGVGYYAFAVGCCGVLGEVCLVEEHV